MAIPAARHAADDAIIMATVGLLGEGEI